MLNYDFQKKSCARGRFTLIELLIVIAIIAILAAMLLPALRKAQDTVLLGTCGDKIRQLATWGVSYADDWSEVLPTDGTASARVTGDGGYWAYISSTNWWVKHPKYAKNSDKKMYAQVETNYYRPTKSNILHCPLNSTNSTRWYTTSVEKGYSMNPMLGGDSWCSLTPHKLPKLKHLNSKIFWFSDPSAALKDYGKDTYTGAFQMGGYSDPFKSTSDIMLNDGKWIPWVWTTAYHGYSSHAGKKANFVFGDGHVEALTYEETINSKEKASFIGGE